jgi:inner membrane protein
MSGRWVRVYCRIMTSPPRSFSFDLGSPTLRALAVGVLVLLLQIPVLLVSGLADERRVLRDAVAHEVGEKWGANQVVVGPFVEVPYVTGEESAEPRLLRFLPEALTVEAEIDVETRSRGIFSVPVYTARLTLHGAFAPPEIDETLGTVDWSRARLVLGIDDPSAIRKEAALQWDGRAVALEPGARMGGVEASVPVSGAGDHRFRFDLELAGTEGLFVVPVGEHSTLALRSPWPHPSFQGSWLPDVHEVSDTGFTARWEITELARGFPTQWTADMANVDDMMARLRAAAVGVTLTSSVDHYVMSARSTRYAILFFVAVFGVLWVLEVRGGFRLHPVHYLLTGAALCSFHLLILALAEHLGFGIAYVLSAGMVTLLLTYYAHGALRSAMGAASVGTTCMAIYGYLYVCLANEDHALLFGAIGVFVGIALVMVLTRRLAWVAPTFDES